MSGGRLARRRSIEGGGRRDEGGLSVGHERPDAERASLKTRHERLPCHAARRGAVMASGERTLRTSRGNPGRVAYGARRGYVATPLDASHVSSASRSAAVSGLFLTPLAATKNHLSSSRRTASVNGTPWYAQA